MLKIKTTNGKIINSHSVYELFNFVMENDLEYSFFKNYVPISQDTFLKMFLHQTKNWNDYHKLYLKLNPTITITKYLHQ